MSPKLNTPAPYDMRKRSGARFVRRAQARGLIAVVVIVMVVMPTPDPTGFNDAARKHSAGDQQREDASQFASHGLLASMLIFVMFFPQSMFFHSVMAFRFRMFPNVSAMFPTPNPAVVPINLLDHRLLHDGCPSPRSDRHGANPDFSHSSKIGGCIAILSASRGAYKLWAAADKAD